MAYSPAAGMYQGFPGYQPPGQYLQMPGMNQIQQPAQSPVMQNQQDMIQAAWVNNENDVLNFMILPGGKAFLISRNEPVFWVKAVDQAGMPLPLQMFKYTKCSDAAQGPQNGVQKPLEGYVTRDEYNALNERTSELETRLNSLMSSRAGKNLDIVREVMDDGQSVI